MVDDKEVDKRLAETKGVRDEMVKIMREMQDGKAIKDLWVEIKALNKKISNLELNISKSKTPKEAVEKKEEPEEEGEEDEYKIFG